jgi:hypothetical protein
MDGSLARIPPLLRRIRVLIGPAMLDRAQPAGVADPSLLRWSWSASSSEGARRDSWKMCRRGSAPRSPCVRCLPRYSNTNISSSIGTS